MRGAKIRKKTPRTAFRLLCLLSPGSVSLRSRPSSRLPGLAASLSPAPSGRVENGKTKAEGPKTLRRFPYLPLPAARYSIRSVNSRVWGGVQTWSSQLCQPTVQVAVPVPLPLTGSVSVTSFS